MDIITLNFGCKISKRRFSVLWKATNVSVLIGMKKMVFFLSHDSVEYQLQLSYENIWKMVMYTSSGLLLIQLCGAPRIYKKLGASANCIFVRTTDFTPSCVGQSSGLCLQLPHGMEDPISKDDFIYYYESETPLRLVAGYPFCVNLPLVPIVQPPKGVLLPYRILFKVCSLVQNGCLPGLKLDTHFFNLVDSNNYDIRYIEHALEKLYYLKECCYDPVSWLIEQYHKYRTFKEQPKPPIICLSDGLVYVHRVQVTPTRVYFFGPEVNMSNRVLRHFRTHIDNFLRVSFIDEEWDKMYSTDLSPRVPWECKDKVV